MDLFVNINFCFISCVIFPEFGDRQDTSSLNGHLPLANKDAEKRLAAADPMDQSSK